MNDAPRFQNWLVLTPVGMISPPAPAALGVGGGAGGGEDGGVPGGLMYCQIPEKSGLPSAVLGVGPFKSSFAPGAL